MSAVRRPSGYSRTGNESALIIFGFTYRYCLDICGKGRKEETTDAAQVECIDYGSLLLPLLSYYTVFYISRSYTPLIELVNNLRIYGRKWRI